MSMNRTPMLRDGAAQAIEDLAFGLAPPALAAHRHLLSAAGAMNLSAEPRVSAIRAVKLYSQDRRYLFSWIINRAHLLFYLRKPALDVMPSLKAGAQARLRGVAVNNAGEETIRVETPQDAQALTDWLFARETWSGPDAPVELTRQGLLR